jgi:hypothetical protein
MREASNFPESLDESEYESAFGEDEAENVQRVLQYPMPMMPFAPSVVLPLPPQYAMGQTTPEPLLTRKFAGLPVWLWGTIVVGGGALYFTTRKSAKSEESSSESKSEKTAKLAKLAANKPERREGSWEPSRTRFAEALKRHYASNIETLYIDADEAAKHCKTVSPLVNAKMRSGFKVDAAFEAFCKKEGLFPVEHEDCVGFYPEDGTERGAVWEEYVDALRDDGQTR